MLGWLDAAMLRVVAAVSAAPAPPHADSATPTLVLIDAEAYDRHFALRSPLDRRALQEGLREILDAGPERLILDLQLEPAGGDVAQGSLDELLQAAAGRTRIVLPVPEPRTAQRDAVSLQWMRQMCLAGVEFGSPELLSHFGAVVRLSTDPLALASVAALPAQPAASAAARQPGAACALAVQVSTLRAMSDLLAQPGSALPMGTALRPSAVERVQSQQLAWRPGEMHGVLAQRVPRTVVVGGSYDARDTFLLLGRSDLLPGALVHAVASDPRAGAKESHLGAWGADLLIGTAAGAVLQALWWLVRRAQRPCTEIISRLCAAEKATAWRGIGAVGAGVLASLPPIALWVLVLAMAVAAMNAAAALLESAFWLNPGPMILGMALHAQLLAQHGAHHDIANWQQYVKDHPFAPLQLALGGFTLAYLLYGVLLHH